MKGVDSTGVRIGWWVVSRKYSSLQGARAAASRCFISNLWFVGREAMPLEMEGLGLEGMREIIGWLGEKQGREELGEACPTAAR